VCYILLIDTADSGTEYESEKKVTWGDVEVRMFEIPEQHKLKQIRRGR
jgi:hypothetical protein